jgi:hypothetical protein
MKLSRRRLVTAPQSRESVDDTPRWLAANTLFGLAVSMPPWGQGQPQQKYAAKVPSYIMTPDTVETRIGTLKFFDGQLDPATVQKVYDNLDFARGVEARLSGIPAASLYAICEGLNQAGIKPNSGIGITEDLIDARSPFLTAQSTTPYVMMSVDLQNGPMVVEVPQTSLVQLTMVFDW